MKWTVNSGEVLVFKNKQEKKKRRMRVLLVTLIVAIIGDSLKVPFNSAGKHKNMLLPQINIWGVFAHLFQNKFGCVVVLEIIKQNLASN